mmetsp:Transcript_13547/g.40141  ORF Transcript_13547/g.40141 Transcript_13547/m.40141 type:complete len:251 (+) Transcript_13547:1932-2684(+)
MRLSADRSSWASAPSKSFCTSSMPFMRASSAMASGMPAQVSGTPLAVASAMAVSSPGTSPSWMPLGLSAMTLSVFMAPVTDSAASSSTCSSSRFARASSMFAPSSPSWMHVSSASFSVARFEASMALASFSFVSSTRLSRSSSTLACCRNDSSTPSARALPSSFFAVSKSLSFTAAMSSCTAVSCSSSACAAAVAFAGSFAASAASRLAASACVSREERAASTAALRLSSASLWWFMASTTVFAAVRSSA